MPPVTSIPEREPKPRRTAADKRADTVRMAHAVQRKRPFALAKDGYPAPTELEIAEGIAHKMWIDNRRSEILKQEARGAFFALMDAEGPACTTRCAECHVVKFGRPQTAPCGHCGAFGEWYDEIRRYVKP